MKFLYEHEGKRREVEMPQEFIDEFLRLAEKSDAPGSDDIIQVYVETDYTGRKKRGVDREQFLHIELFGLD